MSFIMQLEWLLIIACGIMIVLVGCAMRPTVTPAIPTATVPPVTLTIVPFSPTSVVPRSTLPQRATQTHTMPPGLTLDATQAPPDTISVGKPTCFSSPNQGYLCLGQIHNESGAAVQHLEFSLSVPSATDDDSTQNRFLLSQEIIPKQASAPYHLFLKDITHIDALTGIIHHHQVTDDYTPRVAIADQRGDFDTARGRYIITAILHNTSPIPVARVQIVGTVFDVDGRNVGYRVLHHKQVIPADGRETIRLEIIPQIISPNLSHRLFVD